jgi:hypothetical protein
MLMVIAIIGVVAGLVVGLAAAAGPTKRIARTKTEREKLVVLIESYKSKLGVYPPDHPTRPEINTLLYELAGAIRNTNSTPVTYITPFGNVDASALNNSFGVNGILNAVDIGGETNQIHRFLRDIRPDQVAGVVSATLSLVIPVDGPGASPRPNPWSYLAGDNATNNPTSFDLWVDIMVRGRTQRIGNWKD